jgi:hypothetical protein
LRRRFSETIPQVDEWKRTNRTTGNLYKLFAIS